MITYTLIASVLILAGLFFGDPFSGVVLSALVASPRLWAEHIEQQGFRERQIGLDDVNTSEVTAYDQAVAASPVSGKYTVWHTIFTYQVPDTSRVRLINGMIPRIKLFEATGAGGSELAGSVVLKFGIAEPHGYDMDTVIAWANYSRWKRVAADSQVDVDLNQNLALNFENRVKQMFGGPFVDLTSKQFLVIAMSGEGTNLFDKDNSNSVIEIDIGIK